MKKSQFTTYLTIFISVIILGLPAFAQKKKSQNVAINFSNIIGKWSISTLTPKMADTAAAGLKRSTSHDTTNKTAATQTQARPKVDKGKYAEINKSVRRFNNSTFEFFPDKTTVITRNSKPDKYSWKKKKKTMLVLKNVTTKEKISLQVLKLNSDTLHFTQNLNSGSLDVIFVKVK